MELHWSTVEEEWERAIADLQRASTAMGQVDPPPAGERAAPASSAPPKTATEGKDGPPMLHAAPEVLVQGAGV